MQSVALICQPVLIEARRLAEECAKVVEAEGYLPRLLSAWELSGEADISQVRLAMTFGGDGTIIRAARWLAGSGVPILGVAMGKLGFLTELPPETACASIPSVLAGNFWRDERSMLSARLGPAPDAGEAVSEDPAADRADAGPGARLIALNDVVVARGASPRVVQIDLSIDGTPVASYVADGLVVSTPTGSTAYALAAGGPVMAPEVQGILLVPIAAHLAVLRSLVVPLSAHMEIRASSDQPAYLVLDGQVQIPVKNQQPIWVEVARERTLFARLGSRSHFYQTLVQSLKKR